MSSMLDTIIVGGGVAGLSAALYLGRFRRKVIIFDTQKPANRFSHAAHSYFTRDGVAPAELNAIGRAQLEPYATVEIRDLEIVTIVPDGDHFAVTSADGSRFTTRKVLLATGLKDTLAPISGIESFWGTSVFHCPYCDGWELRDQSVAIVGSVEAGLHYARLLRVLTSDLTLCTNGDTSLDAPGRALLDKHGIALIETPIERLEGQDGQVEQIAFVDGSHLTCKGIFAATTMSQHADFAAQLGCDMTSSGLVQVDELGHTNIPGVYAAGDLAQRMRQVIFASAQGAAAGIGINMELIDEDFV